MDEKCVKALVFYSVDAASPYALAQHPETDSYEKISSARLTQLAIGDEDQIKMWMYINAYSGKCGAKPVPATAISDCITVSDVYDAVATATNSKANQ